MEFREAFRERVRGAPSQKLFRETGMEGCFIERCVALDVAKLSRFPAIFFRIKRRVERKCVDVVMRIGDAVDGPCFGVNKARVG